MVENITDENYEEVIQSSASLIAYGIGSCVPCAAYDPILESISSQFPHIRIGKAKMHVPGKCREIKKRHQFVTYPTTHLFSQGTLLHSQEGKIEEVDLAALLSTHFPQE